MKLNLFMQITSRLPFRWLQTAFGTALLATIWAVGNPFGGESLMD